METALRDFESFSVRLAVKMGEVDWAEKGSALVKSFFGGISGAMSTEGAPSMTSSMPTEPIMSGGAGDQMSMMPEDGLVPTEASGARMAALLGGSLRTILISAFVPAVKGLASGFWSALSEELGTAGAGATVLGLALMTPLRGAILAAGGALVKQGWSLFSGFGKGACDPKSIISGAECAAGKALPVLTSGGGVLAKLGKKISGTLSGSGKQLELFGKPSVLKRIGGKAADLLGKGMTAPGAVKSAFGKVGAKVTGTLGKTLLKVGAKGVLTKIPLLGGLVGGAFELSKSSEEIAKGNLAAGTTRILAGVTDGLLLGIPSMAGAALGVDVIGETSTLATEGYAIIGEESAKAWDGIEISAADAWSRIKDTSSETWDGVKLFSGDASSWVVDKLSDVRDGGVDAFGKIGDWVGKLGDKWEPVKNSIVSGMKYVAVLVKNDVLAAFEKVGNIFDSIFDNWELGLLRTQGFFLDAALKVTAGIRSMMSVLPSGLAASVFGTLGEMDKTLEGKRTGINDRIKVIEEAKKTEGIKAAQLAASRAKEEADAKAAVEKAVSRIGSTTKAKEASAQAIASAIMISGFDRAALSQLGATMLEAGTRMPVCRPGPNPSPNGGRP